jgi:hypothetical protein
MRGHYVGNRLGRGMLDLYITEEYCRYEDESHAAAFRRARISSDHRWSRSR